jgi:flagellar motor protein MotB
MAVRTNRPYFEFLRRFLKTASYEELIEAIKFNLEKKGISGSRIKAKGYGETRPIADNTSATGKAKNRRTEFMIISM